MKKIRESGKELAKIDRDRDLLRTWKEQIDK